MRIVQKDLHYNTSHIILQINTLKLQEYLVFDIYIKKDNNYSIIIEAGTILSENLYKKLKNQNKLYIQKEDKAKIELTCGSLKSYIRHSKNDPETTINLLYEINNRIFTQYLNSKEDKIDLECIEFLAKSIIFLIQDNNSYLKNSISFFLNDSKLYIHSLHVAIYSINLAHYLKLEYKQLLQLGIASLLHDTGIKNIDETILSQEHTLSENDMKHIKLHPQHSADIARSNKVTDPYIIDAIMHHHENYDGSGYPNSLKEVNINNFAAILSISDVFDALTSNRPYREKYSSFEALNLMLKDDSMMHKFNHDFLKKFLHYFVK